MSRELPGALLRGIDIPRGTLDSMSGIGADSSRAPCQLLVAPVLFRASEANSL